MSLSFNQRRSLFQSNRFTRSQAETLLLLADWLAPTSGMVPYVLPAGETFTVPENKQALFSHPIDIGAGAAMVVDGVLIEV